MSPAVLQKRKGLDYLSGGLLLGFWHVLSPVNLVTVLVGCILGTVVGVLPGLGPAGGAALLLPITLHLPPTVGIILLAGIVYGSMYGGSTISILMNIPGEAASVPTCLDGFPMARQGRAGHALAISAIGSFIAGTIGVLALSVVGPPLADLGLLIGPPEFFGLLVLSLTLIVSLSGVSLRKGIISGLLGLFLGTIGMDPLDGVFRLTFRTTTLLQGFDLIAVIMGLFGVAEVLSNADEGIQSVFQGKLGQLLPRGRELWRGVAASLRGTVVGLFLGVIPGLLAPVSSFLAYDVEKKLSKHPERFGTGMIEGVAAPESANNAHCQTAFIPLMCLGIPTSPFFAIILAALLMQGLQPGPLLFKEHGDFAWTVIASMYVGNVMLLILNLPLVGLWAQICYIPYRILGPLILAICFVGAYSVRNSMFDVGVSVVFGLIGYYMRKRDWPAIPLILGFMLGPQVERAVRQSFQMVHGSIIAILSRPVTAAFLIVAALAFLATLWFRHAKTPISGGNFAS